MKTDFFESDLLRYRLITEEDTEVVLKLRNNEHVRRNYIHTAVITPEEHLYYFENKIKTGKVIQYLMETKEEGTPIGCTFLKDIDYNSKQAEFGIFIGDKDAIGKGYGTDAVKQMINLAFTELKLHKLILRVLGHNKKAYLLYQKVGFREVERITDKSPYLDESREIILMSLFNSEV